MRCRICCPLLGELAETPPAFAHALPHVPARTGPVRSRGRAHQPRARFIARSAGCRASTAGSWRIAPSASARRNANGSPRTLRSFAPKCASVSASTCRSPRFRPRSSTPSSKLFKKSYTAGRRELEHEFGKTMRYKSIRDLAAGDTRAGGARPQADLADEPAQRLGHAAARRRICSTS